MFQTGTGRGQIVGYGRIDFHAGGDRILRSCAVSWESDPKLVPFLPGIAFDEFLPNLRMDRRDGVLLSAKDIQQADLADFKAWVAEAGGKIASAQAPPCFERLPLARPTEDERIEVSAEITVRLNPQKERLWGETSYSAREARSLLFSVIYTLLWDWCISSGPGAPAVLAALEPQLAYYDEHGTPSDFLLKQIGRAPYASWKARSAATSTELRQPSEWG